MEFAERLLHNLTVALDLIAESRRRKFVSDAERKEVQRYEDEAKAWRVRMLTKTQKPKRSYLKYSIALLKGGVKNEQKGGSLHKPFQAWNDSGP